MKAIVTWAGGGSVQSDDVYEDVTRIKPQMFHDAPIGPMGGRPARVTEYDADGRRVAQTLYAECIKIRVEFDGPERGEVVTDDAGRPLGVAVRPETVAANGLIKAHRNGDDG